MRRFPPAGTTRLAPESRDIVTLEKRYGLYIGGELIEPRSGEYSTISPASEEGRRGWPPAPRMSTSPCKRPGTRTTTAGRPSPGRAGEVLFRIARILQERSREFAVLESLNGGKPIKESRDVDIPLAAAHFFYYAGWADKLEYAFRTAARALSASPARSSRGTSRCSCWRGIAPALAAGNTVVLKPAETTPLSALLFADVLRQAELPPGVVNIITGDGRAGAELVKHPDVDKIAFTARPRWGRRSSASSRGRQAPDLELGANIIFDDAALDQAVEGIVNGIYFNQGHVCCAGSRLLVQESIYEPVIEKLKRRLTTLRVGDPLDKNTDVGAINSKQQLEKIEELVRSGEEEGAEIYQPPCRLPEKGYWFVPTASPTSRRATGSRRRRSGPSSRC